MSEVKVYYTSWGKVRTAKMRIWTEPFVSKSDYDNLQAKLKIAIDALEFYADKRKYEGANQRADQDEKEKGHCVANHYRLDVTRDLGNLAATALKQLEDK